MKKIDNKGFTFVEILAVIVLIGILSSIAIIGVSRYRDNAKNKDYEALARSSYNAMEEYMIKHPYKKKASLETLENGSFLSNRKDPGTKTTDCTGSVEVEKEMAGTNGTMDKNKFSVYLCCTNYKKKYTYPEGNVDPYNGTDKCDIDESSAEPDPIPDPTEPTYTCPAGKYLPKTQTTCAICTSGNYCPGGTWNKSNTQDQGLKPCPNGYKNSESGSSKIDQCYMKVTANKYVKTAKATTSIACEKGHGTSEHNVFYGKTSSCKAFTCTITYNANGGVFTKKDSIEINPTIKTDIQIQEYGKYLGGKDGSMRDANGGYYAAVREYYHVDSNEAWKSGNKIFDEGKHYLAEEMCDLSKGDNSITLNVNWKKNTIKIIYNANGGTLACGGHQICPRGLGCSTNPSSDKYCQFTANDSMCTGEKTGDVARITRVYDTTQWKAAGLADHKGKGAAHLYMTKSGKTATRYWHVNSKNASKKINELTTYESGKALANAMGKGEDLKTKNISVRLYAGWQ